MYFINTCHILHSELERILIRIILNLAADGIFDCSHISLGIAI